MENVALILLSQNIPFRIEGSPQDTLASSMSVRNRPQVKKGRHSASDGATRTLKCPWVEYHVNIEFVFW